MNTLTSDWRHSAECRDAEDPELWWPVSAADPATQARRACHGCVVRKECALAALREGHSAGIWAGFRLPEEKGALRAYAEDEALPTSHCACGRTIVHAGRLRQSKCVACRLGLIDDTEVREHIIALSRAGLDHTLIGELADVSRRTVGRIARGETEGVKPEIAHRILSIHVADQLGVL